LLRGTKEKNRDFTKGISDSPRWRYGAAGRTRGIKPTMVTNPEESKKRDLVFTGRHLPYNPRLLDRARELRKNMTGAEKKLWNDYLCHCKYRVLRQRPIDHYIVDFYCSSVKLVIEIDGEQHFTEEGKCYDSERDSILSSYDLEILHVKNKEIMEHFDDVCVRIGKYF